MCTQIEKLEMQHVLSAIISRHNLKQGQEIMAEILQMVQKQLGNNNTNVNMS